MRFRPFVHFAIALGFSCLQQLLAQAPAPAPQDDRWAIRFYKDEPYLTLETIQRKYGFASVATQGNGFELRSPTAVIEGAAGNGTVLVNRLRYQLHLEPKRDGERCLISAYDLTNLLDLLLRPGNHMQPTPIKTVYIQPVDGDILPEGRQIAFALQDVLRGFGFNVRFLDPEAEGIVGEALEVEEEGGVIWLRLHGNIGLLARNARCTVLAPPGAPSRAVRQGATEADVGAVYLGNLYDSESLALATLIQTGLNFGPGARNGGTVDAGVRQWPIDPFQRGSGAAVQIEWGEDLDPEHILKSITAAVLRYAGFVEGAAERVQEFTKAREPAIRVSDVSLKLRDEDEMLVVNVGLARATELLERPDPAKVDVQVFLFSQEQGSAVDLISAPPPKIEWVSLLADWTEEDPERLQLLYHIGKDEAGEFRKKTFGHIVRISYDGKFQEAVAEPQGLLNQLWRFSAVFPK